MVLQTTTITLLVVLIFLVGALLVIVWKRTFPPYKPNRHTEKPQQAGFTFVPPSSKMKPRVKMKPKVFTDEEIWIKLNERRDHNSSLDGH